MTSALFIAFVGLTTCAAIATGFRYLQRELALRVLLWLTAWILYVGLLGYFGVTGNDRIRPPGLTLVLVPVLIFVVWLARSNMGIRIATAIPLALLLGLQTYRIAVELFLHQLYSEGIVPRMLTYEGANADILLGLTAPLAAWVWNRGPVGLRLALLWNVAGLLTLANIVIRFIATTPGPTHFIRTTLPNLAASTFPYMYLPGLLAPLALVLHVLSIRAILTPKDYCQNRNACRPNATLKHWYIDDLLTTLRKLLRGRSSSNH